LHGKANSALQNQISESKRRNGNCHQNFNETRKSNGKHSERPKDNDRQITVEMNGGETAAENL
jgi:hypothetical protein